MIFLILENKCCPISSHGFVPNGGRVYYLTRSQPPLLIPMVYEYYMSTGDLEFVMEILPTLEKEYEFWVKNRQGWFKDKDGEKRFPYYQYKAKLKVPRPESYREDFELAEHLETEEEKIRMWSEVASAAETGWDFSTRWFSQTGDEKHRMDSIRYALHHLRQFFHGSCKWISVDYTLEFRKVDFETEKEKFLNIFNFFKIHWSSENLIFNRNNFFLHFQKYIENLENYRFLNKKIFFLIREVIFFNIHWKFPFSRTFLFNFQK